MFWCWWKVKTAIDHLLSHFILWVPAAWNALLPHPDPHPLNLSSGQHLLQEAFSDFACKDYMPI